MSVQPRRELLLAVLEVLACCACMLLTVAVCFCAFVHTYVFVFFYFELLFAHGGELELTKEQRAAWSVALWSCTVLHTRIT